jgi:hypothetical protein
MGEVFPLDQLLAVLPDDERAGDIAAAVNRLLMSDDPQVCDRAARAGIRSRMRSGCVTAYARLSVEPHDAPNTSHCSMPIPVRSAARSSIRAAVVLFRGAARSSHGLARLRPQPR